MSPERKGDGRYDEDGPIRGRGLIDVVAHELRTPLAAILGYQELMEDGVYGPLPKGIDDAVRRIGRSARQLLSLVDGLDLLDADSQEPAVGAAAFDVSTVLEALAPVAQEDARARGLHLDVDLPTARLLVRCDPAALRALLELLVGALFKTAASGRFSLRAARGAADMVHITLADTPLDPAVDAPLTAAEIRTGAGLRVLAARRLAARMNGVLELDERGTLRLTLPGAQP
ncbi:MAG: HAMP domain-containing sensor histidine kinase [Gemmatimonadota bacterium]